MSERAVLAEWRDTLRDSELDPTAKLVGFILSTWWDRNGRSAFPSKPTIAAASGVSKRAVDGAVDRLETAGFSRRVAFAWSEFEPLLGNPSNRAGRCRVERLQPCR